MKRRTSKPTERKPSAGATGGRPVEAGGGRGAIVALALDPPTAALLRAVSRLRLGVQSELAREGLRRVLEPIIRATRGAEREALRAVAQHELKAILEQIAKRARTDTTERATAARDELDRLLGG